MFASQLGRRRFLKTTAAATIPAALFSNLSAANASTAVDSEFGEWFPTTDLATAKEFVGVSHGNLARVEEMLKQNTELAKSSWDWGFGDWETALGAASHTGQIPIIEVLMAHGARANLFTLSTLDCVDAVRAVCESIPGIQRTLGPHGITLYWHALAGKATRVQEYLDELGGANVGQPEQPISEADSAPYLGEYQFGSGDSDRLIVRYDQTRSALGLERVGGSPRFLAMQEPNLFAVFGAPGLRIRFEVAGEVASRLTIERGSFQLTATRV